MTTNILTVISAMAEVATVPRQGEHARPRQPVITLSVVSRSALVVSWPAPTAGYVLQTSTNRSSGGWTGIGIPPVMSNGQMQVTVPMSGPATFYRLVKP